MNGRILRAIEIASAIMLSLTISGCIESSGGSNSSAQANLLVTTPSALSVTTASTASSTTQTTSSASHNETLLCPDGSKPNFDMPDPCPTIPVQVFPPLEEWASAAFEDNFPNEGDADFNDTIVNFKVVETLNSLDQIMGIAVTFQPRVACAGDDHAILLNVTGHTPHKSYVSQPLFNGAATSATMTVTDAAGNVGQPTNVDATQDIVVFASTKQNFMQSPDGSPSEGNCGAGQTSAIAARTVTLNFTLQNPELNASAASSINLGAVRIMLHVLPTDQYIDMIDVDSSAIDSKGMPFGLVIPTNWDYPLEGVNINKVYPLFASYMQALLSPSTAMTPEVQNWFALPATGATGTYYISP